MLRWDIESGEESRQMLIEKPTAFDHLKSGFAWGPDNSVVVLRSGTITHYSSEGEQQGVFPIGKVIDIVTLESGSERRHMMADCFFWNLATDEQATENSRGFVHSIFRPGTTEIWGRSHRGRGAIAKWNPSTGKRDFPFKEGLNSKSTPKNGSAQHQVESIAFSPNGKILASIGSDSCIHLWNVTNGSRISTLEVTKGPRKGKNDDGVGRPALKMVKFSPDGHWLVACSVESVSVFKIDRIKPYFKPGKVYNVTQYFAGTEFVEEIVTNPRGAKTFVGSTLHTEEQEPGDRVAALRSGKDDVWYDAVVLAKLASYGAKKGIYYNVHFEGYSREDDQRVPEWRLRPKLAPRLKVRNSKK